MNYLSSFKIFYLRTVLPNAPSFKSYFGISNFDKQIEKLITVYEEYFGNDPFEISDVVENISLLKTNLGKTDDTFSKYSDQTGSGVPKAILRVHFLKFLEYYNKQILFPNLKVFVDLVNEEVNTVGKKENFIEKFREFRKVAVGQSRVMKANLLFGDVRNNSWTINLGSEKELQYHIHLNEEFNSIRYGLGFNMQASGNNREPTENAKPFKEAFYARRLEVDSILQDYRFWYDDEENLKKLLYGKFSLYGQEIPIVINEDNYEVQGLDYLKMLYDLKHKQFKAYMLIFQNSKMPSPVLLNSASMNNYIELLRYKKQIILQGPPGTGKTKLAKEIANILTGGNNFPSDNEIISLLKNVKKINTAAGNVEYELVKVDRVAKEISLRKSTDTVATTNFDKIRVAYNTKCWERSIGANDDRRACAIAKYLHDICQNNSSNNISNTVIVQFHPSYTYEDFVSGIVAKPNESGEGILYEAENKILGNLAKEALNNYLASKGESKVDLSFQSKLNNLLEKIREKIDAGLEFKFDEKSTAHIIAIKEDGILYSFPQREDIRYKLLFGDIEKIYNYRGRIKKPIDLRDAEIELGLGMKGKYPYYYMILRSLEEIDASAGQVREEELKNFVLIIDEINRANLSSVFGELIYALEYRSEEIISMYAVNNDAKLILPPNLYIIGTMNTADRSVGHIDYAIRRRFAFIDVLPKDLSNEHNIIFDSVLFEKITKLFITNYDDYKANPKTVLIRAETLSSEFRPEDIWLGHSYFIDKAENGGDMVTRLEYEIRPILMEYIRDGILVGKVKSENVTISIEDYVKSL